jgi:hypothetical protein
MSWFEKMRVCIWLFNYYPFALHWRLDSGARMASQDSSGGALQHELTAMSDSLAQEEELPLTSSLEKSAGNEDESGRESSNLSSVSGASFNFINTIVGAGIIGVPYSIYQACRSQFFGICFSSFLSSCSS